MLETPPLNKGAYATLIGELEKAYSDCVTDFRFQNDIVRLHWSLFREAKLRLLMGDVAFENKNLKDAREDYQLAYDLSNEIASYRESKLSTAGSNNKNSYSATTIPFPSFSVFREVATDLRTIARAALEMVAKH